jgi:hypothetical protein
MDVTLTISRVIRQYTDVVVKGVDTEDAAAQSARADLEHPVKRVRLLRGATWYGDTLLEAEDVIDDATMPLP